MQATMQIIGGWPSVQSSCLCWSQKWKPIPNAEGNRQIKFQVKNKIIKKTNRYPHDFSNRITFCSPRNRCFQTRLASLYCWPFRVKFLGSSFSSSTWANIPCFSCCSWTFWIQNNTEQTTDSCLMLVIRDLPPDFPCTHVTQGAIEEKCWIWGICK